MSTSTYLNALGSNPNTLKLSGGQDLEVMEARSRPLQAGTDYKPFVLDGLQSDIKTSFCAVKAVRTLSPLPTTTDTHLREHTITMFFPLAALVLAAVSQIALATPVTSLTKPTELDVTLAQGFPIRTLDIIRDAITGNVHDGTIGARDTTGTHDGTTGAYDGTILDRAAAANPAILLLCPTTNCATCSGFNLSTFPTNECFLTNVQAVSVGISQPGGGGLPFTVAVGTAQCATLAAIPAVNECFNINGGPFTNFALLE